MVIGITGANGYVGGSLRREVSLRGHSVISFSRSAPDDSTLFRAYSLEAPCTDEMLKGVDSIVHCAFDFSDLTLHSSNLNIAAARRLCEATARCGVRLIHISSFSAFAGCHSRYGRVKLAMEDVFQQCGGINLRAGLVYGPDAGGTIGSLLRLLRFPVVPLAAGWAQQYPVHEADLADAVMKIAERDTWPKTGPVSAAPDRPVTMRRLVQTLARRQGRSVVFLPIPWRCLWLLLRLAELVGYSSRTGSDALVGLAKFSPAPDFGPTRMLGLTFRPFSET